MKKLMALTAVATVGLIACGGDDDDPVLLPPATVPPVTAPAAPSTDSGVPGGTWYEETYEGIVYHCLVVRNYHENGPRRDDNNTTESVWCQIRHHLR